MFSRRLWRWTDIFDSDNQDDRFGGGFLRYFDWSIDESANTLNLAEVKDPALKPLVFKAKKKR